MSKTECIGPTSAKHLPTPVAYTLIVRHPLSKYLEFRMHVSRTRMTVAFLVVSASFAAQSQSNDIPYQSPDEAVREIRKTLGVTERVENEWIVLSDTSSATYWSVTTPGNPAHPSIVKRVIVMSPAGTRLQMQVKCGAVKPVCDRMVESFRQGDSQIRGDLRNGR